MGIVESTPASERARTVIDLRRSDSFAKAFEFTEAADVRSAGLYPYDRRVENVHRARGTFAGNEVLVMSSNDYLGLAADARVRRAAADATVRWGTGSGARLLSGPSPVIGELEERMADWIGVEAVLTFSSGMGANTGFLSALVGRHDHVVIDAHAHASIQAGARVPLSDGITRFRHGDAGDLDTRLARLDPAVGIVVVVDGVYSMGGDMADIAALASVCRSHGGRLVVDDAHGIGVRGGGRGTAVEQGAFDEVDLHTGTFSKALASAGGYVAGNAALIDFIQHRAVSSVFTVALSPAGAAAATASLRIMQSEPERIALAVENGDRLRHGLSQAGFDIGRSNTSVGPITVGPDLDTLGFWRLAVESGVHTSPVIYPAVSRGHGVLRLTATAAHTATDIDEAVERLTGAARRFGLLP